MQIYYTLIKNVAPFFPPPTSCSVRVGGSRGGSDSGTYASPPFYHVFPFSLNVVNEYEKPLASFLLEIDLAVCPESSYYYYHHCIGGLVA